MLHAKHNAQTVRTLYGMSRVFHVAKLGEILGSPENIKRLAPFKKFAKKLAY